MSSTVASQSLKERQRQEREQLILQAAEELLIEQGYHETSMEQIAARVGVSKGTLYLHFQSKEELLMALLQRDQQQFYQAVVTLLSAEGSPRERLQSLIAYIYNGMFGKHFQLLNAVFQNPELRGKFADLAKGENERHKHAAWEEIGERVDRVLDEGKACGEFDTSMPTAVMRAMFTNLLNPHSFSRMVSQDHLDQRTLVEQVCRFFFKGIAAESPHDHTAVCGKEGEAYAPVE